MDGGAGAGVGSGVRRRTVRTVAVIGAAAVVAWAGWVVLHDPDGDRRFCNGVGLDGPTAASPEAAVEAWAVAHGDLGGWERDPTTSLSMPDATGSEELVAFTRDAPDGELWRVDVRGADARWRVFGGCVE
jgi:hypothetical protein